MESQKSAEDSYNSHGFIVLQTQFNFSPNTLNKQVFIYSYDIKKIFFYFMINSLLAKLGQSRGLDVGLILFLAFYGSQLPLNQ